METKKTHRPASAWIPAAVALIEATVALGLPGAQAGSTTTSAPSPEKNTFLSDWWNGKGATANWLGAGDLLEPYGLSVTGEWKGTFYGNVSGGYQNHGAFDEELKFTAKYDFEKVFGLKGFSAQGTVRWRDGDNINNWVGAQNQFQPSRFQSGKGWRILPFFLTYENPNKSLSISGGWVNPYDLFLQSDGTKFLTNGQLGTSKGLGANGVPWGSSYAGWGGTLKVKPTKSTYVQGGLYEAIPNSAGVGTNQYGPYYTLPPLNAQGGNGVPVGQGGQIKHQGVNASKPQRQPRNNHGLYFAGAYPGSPGGNPGSNANGLFAVAEIGWTPKIGPDKLEGKYAIGGLYWGLQNTVYDTTFVGPTAAKPQGSYARETNTDGRYSLYWQFDQQLYREHQRVKADAPVSDGKSVADGKSFSAPITRSSGELSKQGLYSYNHIVFSPQYNNPLSFYWQSQLVYQGLIPGRDDDKFSVAFGYANFSAEQIETSAQINHYTYATTTTTSTKTSTVGGKPVTTTTTTKTVNRIGKGSVSPQWGAVIEFDYVFQINKWAYITPYLQYIINPSQNYTVQNATIIGAQAGIKF